MDYFYAPGIPEGADFLDEEESAHCVRVLRYKEGDVIGLLDGRGGKYSATIRQANPKNLSFTILDRSVTKKAPYSIHLAIAPTKNADRMEWLAEKLTEIGVDKITLFFSANSERRKYNTRRLQKKLVTALKQSKNPFLPELTGPVELNTLFTSQPEKQKFIAFVDADNTLMLQQAVQKKSSALILIGPEGDFTAGEVQQAEKEGYQKVSLGKNVLRTETAGLIACHTIHLINTN